jgi:hypothetical protein
MPISLPYSRDLKIAAMRALDAGSTIGEIARKYQLRGRAASNRKGSAAEPLRRHLAA